MLYLLLQKMRKASETSTLWDSTKGRFNNCRRSQTSRIISFGVWEMICSRRQPSNKGNVEIWICERKSILVWCLQGRISESSKTRHGESHPGNHFYSNLFSSSGLFFAQIVAQQAETLDEISIRYLTYAHRFLSF